MSGYKRETTLFVPAVHFTLVERRNIHLVVLHSMESQEKPGTARQVATWFGGPKAPDASAHYCVDDTEIIQCVEEEAIAWGAPGANANGIQVELAGRAEQSASQWIDAYSRSMLWLAAPLVADICRRHGIPAEIVDVRGLRHGDRGITRHMDVSQAFKKSTHTDPGSGFPLKWFVSRVQQEMERER